MLKSNVLTLLYFLLSIKNNYQHFLNQKLFQKYNNKINKEN